MDLKITYLHKKYLGKNILLLDQQKRTWEYEIKTIMFGNSIHWWVALFENGTLMKLDSSSGIKFNN